MQNHKQRSLPVLPSEADGSMWLRSQTFWLLSAVISDTQKLPAGGETEQHGV